MTGSGTVRVVVQDVNDHSPVFERQSYTAVILENSPAGTTVLQATATDLDADFNAKIRYARLFMLFGNAKVFNGEVVCMRSQILIVKVFFLARRPWFRSFDF